MQTNPGIVKNGFKKAGITETLEKGLAETDSELGLQDQTENDRLSSDSDELSITHNHDHNHPLF